MVVEKQSDDCAFPFSRKFVVLLLDRSHSVFFRIFNFPYVAKILFMKLLYFWQDFAPFALTLVGIERGANCADGTTTGNAKSVYQTRVSSLKRVQFFKQLQEGKQIEIAAFKKNVFCFAI